MSKSALARPSALVLLGLAIWWIARSPAVSDGERGLATIAFYVDDAYPRWRSATGRVCPPDLRTLAPDHATRDPWGNELVMACTTLVESRTPTLLVRSAGPDKRLGTLDDLDSSMTATYRREAALVSGRSTR